MAKVGLVVIALSVADGGVIAIVMDSRIGRLGRGDAASMRRLDRWWGRSSVRDLGGGHAARVEGLLDTWRQQTRTTERDRRRQLAIYSVVAVQAGLAAGLAWLAAREIGVSMHNPVFAPIAAVSTVAAAVGQRLRRVVELIAGVGLGILIADGLLALIGRGAAQTGLIVTATILIAIALTGRGGLITQAGGTAVLVSSVTPTASKVEVPQLVNAVTGGVIGLIVVIALFPLNPLRIVHKAAVPAMNRLSAQLTAAGRALANRDAAGAQAALDQLRDMGSELTRLSDALQGANEVVRFSPQQRRWRNALQQYSDGAEHLNRVVLASRGLTRRSVTLITDKEPLPPTLPDAVTSLGLAVRDLDRDFVAGREPDQARRRSLTAVCQASEACQAGLGLSGTAIMAQVRTIAGELLQATTIGRTDANRLIRQAAN
ncbi:aromatic acid exporter family protein [Micromonospora sp. AMSO31t]|uniref:FUSC family protein n=1 Tax=Micromonospora sp. AMSO31t TaxID=2650566 RepID=UPI00124B766A|nr:FUSC family protein [Micromonospora sp. AMSO31t]KAB1904934.1 aromatic acid exporter family protein [Micromonospora sp. AMSO31t]